MSRTKTAMTGKRSAPPRILVADDQPLIRNLLITALRRTQIGVDAVGDGDEAIARLAEKEYRVLVLDLMMPKVSGWSVIQWLNDHPQRKPHSVIVVSAADREALHSLNPEVVNAIIFKPFDVFELVTYVAACSKSPTPKDRRMRRIVDTSPVKRIEK